MRTIYNFNFKNIRALLRVDFNVPMDASYKITDDTRIRESLPTIQKILGDGGSCIIMTHFGRPKKALHSVALGAENKYSTEHLVPHLSELLGVEVLFADDCNSEKAFKMSKMLKPGSVLLLENTRFYEEETAGDKYFAEMLATMGDVFVNDAFGAAHRAHASTAIIAAFFTPENKMFGHLMAKEIENATKVSKNPAAPFTAIIGGAKVSDKIKIIDKLLDTANIILIGGGMAYTFYKAMGGTIGNSLCEEDKLDLALELIEKAKNKGVKFVLPLDSLIADAFDNNANSKSVNSNEIPSGWMGLDIGAKAISEYEIIIKSSKTILWNGPMGVFEMENFSQGTK